MTTQAAAPMRIPRPCHFLMCPPTYFDVRYAINPWMDPGDPPDRRVAMEQWERLRALLVDLGHRVELAEPEPGLPDMVFAANAATVVDDRILVSSFRHPERRGETAAYERWFRARGYRQVRRAGRTNEGQGDHLLAGGRLLAGHGFRTERESHPETGGFLRRDVVELTLVDARFYHLDTAFAVLAEDTVMYWPGAFSAAGRRRLAALFPDALLVEEADAAAFGLNAVSDGRNVLLPSGAAALADRLRGRGFEPHLVDAGELMKAGGGPKCCVLHLHHASATPWERRPNGHGNQRLHPAPAGSARSGLGPAAATAAPDARADFRVDRPDRAA
ncbi:dimethylargininase [Streptacidiphilus monticola]|uniref:Dimethylargininase n=1 Tax=Streptacidiphilus monticola TaxID=2161674 RepID=A0ABW1FZE6_9ACTN